MYPHSWSAHMPPSCSIVGLETAPARKSSLLLTGSHGRAFENCHETLFKKSNKQKPHQKANERSQLLNSLIKDKVKRHCITSFSWSHQISVQANVGCTGSQSLNIRTALFSLGVFPISLELKIPQFTAGVFELYWAMVSETYYSTTLAKGISRLLCAENFGTTSLTLFLRDLLALISNGQLLHIYHSN